MFFDRIRSFFPYVKVYKREMLIGTAALLLTDLVVLITPWIFKKFIDLLPQKPSGLTLFKYACLLFVVALFQGLFRFGWRKFLFGPSRKIEFDILNRLFAHFQTLDRSYFQYRKIGDLMSRATNDLRSIRDFIGLAGLIMLDSFVNIISCLGLMFYLNPRLALYCLIPLPVVSILFFKFSKTISERHRKVQAHLSKITAMVQENLSGIRVLHAYVQEEHEKRKFSHLNEEYVRKNLDVSRLFGLFTPSLSLTIGIAGLISLWIGGKAVIAGEMTLGSFVAFNGYLMLLSWPMMGIGFVLNLAQKGLSAMDRINEELSARPEIDGPQSDGRDYEINGEIEFRDLNFAYTGEGQFALKDISFRVEAGSRTAIIGMIGAGKSTLVQMIGRVVDPQNGSLLLGGKPFTEIPIPELRKKIGYVDQEPYLFSTSIKNNIALGTENATPEEIAEVARVSGLEPDLMRFPKGLETIVGERGVSLSGGQKQRIALARALLRKPKILVLDDAFSSLDVETEEHILKNIKDYIRGITTLIITHRLSTIKDADQIIVLDRGRIVEKGRHADLIRNDSYYKKVYQNQMLAMEMEILMQ